MTPPPIPPAKSIAVLRLWALALALSAAVVAAGRHWPRLPAAEPALVFALVLGVPLACGLLLLSRWRLPAGHRGESVD